MKDEMVLTNDYLTVHIGNKGRKLVIEINENVKRNFHTKALANYVKHLYNMGVERINCDHIYFDFLDRTMNLARGDRKLDIIYVKDGRLYECELKGPREVGLDRTYKQLETTTKHCDVVTLLVPRDKMEFVKENLEIRKLRNVVVDTYEY